MQPTRTKLEHELSDFPGADQIRAELAAILDSSVFRTSKRCHDFLQYAVSQTLRGDLQNLRERSLAVEVFGRRTNASLGDDSIVRVGAREVRKRLAQYYMTEGAHDAMRIELPAGSYVPVFHAQAAPVFESPEVVSLLPPPAPALPAAPLKEAAARAPVSNQRWLILAGILAAVLLGVLLWRSMRAAVPEEFEAFWRPAFIQQGPVFLGLAHPIVYHPSSRLLKLDDEANGAEAVLQRPIRVAPETNSNDYVPVFDQYVGVGDALAASRLSILFAQHKRMVEGRLASKLSFADLRDSSAILIGAFTNRWSAQLVQSLRYRLGISLGLPWIVDSATGKKWMLSGKTDAGLVNEDYILLCRLTHAQTGGFVIIAAGLTQYGTEEAGRILSDPDSLAPLLRRVASDWRNKNLELVLHSRVLGETSTAPELVASYVW
jgi:hypothetical protein